MDTLAGAAAIVCNGQPVCLADVSIPSALILTAVTSSYVVCAIEQASIRVSSQNNAKLLTHCNATIETQAVVQRHCLEESEASRSPIASVVLASITNSSITSSSVGCVESCSKATQIPASMDASLHLAATFNNGSRNIPYVPSTLRGFSLHHEAATVPLVWVSQSGFMDEKQMLASTRGSNSSWNFEELESKPLGTTTAVNKEKAEHMAEVLYETTYLVEMPSLHNEISTLNCEFEIIQGPGSSKANIASAKFSQLDSLSAALSILQTGSVEHLNVILPAINTLGIHAMLKVGDAELGEGVIGGSLGGGRRQNNQVSSAAQNMPQVDRGYVKTPVLTQKRLVNRNSTLVATGSSSTAIITGGMGALGQLVAEWLRVRQHDGSPLKIILLGRTASQWHPNAAAHSAPTRTESHAVQCDVSQREDFNFDNLGMRSSTTSIYHASGSVKDASISNQNPSLLRVALAPKLDSARSLAAALINSVPIDSWINFSSVVAMLGNGGQGSYAAANGALDGFTSVLNNYGVHCTSVQWGPWAGSGMASVQQGIARRLERLGMVLITPAVGLDALQRALMVTSHPILEAVYVTDWNKLLRSSQKELVIYSELLPEQRVAARKLVKNAAENVNASVRLIAEEAIGKSIEDDNSTFMAIGLDSMGAIELRNALIQKFNIDLPATVTFDYPSVSKLAGFISSAVHTVSEVDETYRISSKQSKSVVDFVSTVQSIVSTVLGKSVSAEEPLMQAGMDSMGAIELRSALESEFSISLPATITYDYPTSTSMGKFLEESSGGGVSGGSSSFATGAYITEHSSSSAAATTGLISTTCMYPNGALTLMQAVSQLSSNTDVQQVVPSSRWDVDAHYNPSPEDGKMYVRFGGWLDNIEAFDSGLLRLSPSESVGMDPQTRLLLEKTFEATSNVADSVSNQIGVYVGCMYTEYLDGILGPVGLANSSASSITGHGLSFMVGRLSFTFGWQGPCISTDTACSSSLVALHLAHQGILRHESEFALAGGVNVMLIPQTTSRICLLQALSVVGRCKALDASSDGYGRSEALCISVLALSTHHKISALIKGSAVQQNGTSSGLTAPNGPSQSALIRQALLVQNTAAASLEAVSLHGTGTPLGDPIEIGALTTALGSKHRDLPLIIGASKTCFGHTEGTAGMTGSLLALTYLQQQISAPITNLRSVNLYVQPSLLKNAAHVPRQAAPTTLGGRGDSCAGTSSFGMSGVNAHVIVALHREYITTDALSTGTPLPMERTRCWPLPQLHPFIRGAATAGAGKIIEFSVLQHAFLHDHQVFGRSIMPASGMFEIMHAAATAGIENMDINATGAITAATIQSALPLNKGPADSVLKASLNHGGAITINGARGVMYIQATYRKLRLSESTATEKLAAPPSNRLSSVLNALFKSESTALSSKGNNFAELASCSTQHLQFFANPASLDACIHLAPVPSAGEPLQETKVPTAVRGILLNSRATSYRKRSWASARTVSLNEGLSNISWFNASSQQQLVDLVAHPMARGGAGGIKDSDISTDFTYEIEWQTSDSVFQNAEKYTSSVVFLDEERILLGDGKNCRGVELSARLLSVAQQVRSYFF